MRIEYEALSELERSTWDGNAKEHDDTQIRQSFDRFGYVLPVTRDEGTGKLVAGHGRISNLAELKKTGAAPPSRVQLRADGEWLVPVIRGVRFASKQEAQAYLLADNRLVELGGWNDKLLAAQLQEVAELGQRGLEGVGWSNAQLDELMADLAALPEPVPPLEAPEPPPVPDVEPPAHPLVVDGSDLDGEDPEPEKPVDVYMKQGQLWKLGRHLLMVGDSFNAEDVARLVKAGKAEGIELILVLMDPPYAIYGSSSGVSSDVADDKMIRPFFEALFRTVHGLLPTFGHVYVFCDWRSWATLWHGAKVGKIAPHNMLVWDKGGAGLGSHYANAHEIIFFGAKMPVMKTMIQARERETGQRVVHKSNVLRFARARGDERLHNAAKPRPLVEQLIQNSSDPEQGVIDLFCGSGTTLVACETTGRRCLTMEIDMANAQIAKERWERMTGQKAVLLSAGT